MIDGPIKGLRADHSGLGTRAHLPTVSPMADPRGMAYLQEVSTLKGSHVMSSDRKALLGAYKERYQGHMVDPKHRRIRLIGKRVMRESQRQQQALEVRGPLPSTDPSDTLQPYMANGDCELYLMYVSALLLYSTNNVL